jgi:CBS-domain-containing membrane protein
VLHTHRVSAVALVGPTGVFADVLCNADVRGMAKLDPAEIAGLLDRSAEMFVARLRSRDLVVCAESPAVHTEPTVTVAPDATFGEAVRALASLGAHRVFILDEGRRPVGVASAGDVLRIAFGVRGAPAATAAVPHGGLSAAAHEHGHR